MIASVLTCGSLAYGAGPKEDINDAAKTFRDFASTPDRQIPPKMLQDAKGFAIFNVVNVALLVSGKGGDGVVVARTPSGWSGPMFIGLGGAGVGAQLGAKVKSLVLVLNSKKAIEAFEHGNVKLGANLSTAAGPANASAEAQTTFTSVDIYSYAASHGVFGGASLQGAVIVPKDDENKDFYGKKVTPSEILKGKVTPPETASALTNVLDSKAGVAMTSAKK